MARRQHMSMLSRESRIHHMLRSALSSDAPPKHSVRRPVQATTVSSSKSSARPKCSCVSRCRALKLHVAFSASLIVSSSVRDSSAVSCASTSTGALKARSLCSEAGRACSSAMRVSHKGVMCDVSGHYNNTSMHDFGATSSAHQQIVRHVPQLVLLVVDDFQARELRKTADAMRQRRRHAVAQPQVLQAL